MSQQDYEYRGMLAQSWDLLRGDTSEWPDRPYYREIIENGGQPALDVGCGTGRLLLDYLSAGLDVDGVDLSPEMLELCREKANKLGLEPNLFQQEMAELDLPRNYRTIFVPSSSFQLVTDLSDAMETLRRFYQHLEPGGTLVISIMDISSDKPIDWKVLSEEIRLEDNLTVRFWWRANFDQETQLQHTENRYELVQDEEVVYTELYRRSPATRNYSLAEILALVEDAGFANVHAVSGESNKPASAEDDVFKIFGVRP